MTRKDRHGGMFSIEFDTPEVPEMDHPGEPRGTDTYPAWLTPGENVVNAEASRKYQPVIDAMNEEGRMMQEAQGGPIPTYAAGGQRVKGKDYWMDGLVYRPMPRKKPQEDFFTMDRITNALGGGMQYLGGIPKSIYEYAQDTDWTPWNSGGAKVPAYYSGGYNEFGTRGTGASPEVNLKLNKRVAPTTWSVQESVPATAIHDGSEEVIRALPPTVPEVFNKPTFAPQENLREPMPIKPEASSVPLPMPKPPMMPPLLPEGDVRIPTGEKDSSVYDLLEPRVKAVDSYLTDVLKGGANAITSMFPVRTDVDGMIDSVLQDEKAKGGGSEFTNYDGDKPTKFGVTLEALKEYNPNATITDLKNLNEPTARKIFKELYYDRYQIGSLPRELQHNMLDMAVNSGGRRAWEVLQRAIGMPEEDVDGRPGDITSAALAAYLQNNSLGRLSQDFTNARGDWYYDVARNNPKKRKFLEGWYNRLEKFQVPQEVDIPLPQSKPDYMSGGGQVPQYYASGSGSWWDPRSWFGNSQPSSQVVSVPSAVNNPASAFDYSDFEQDSKGNLTGAIVNPPPLNQQTPPKSGGEDQGDYGVHDTIVRNGVPYVWNEQENGYVDAEGREFSRNPIEWLGDVWPSTDSLYPTLESQLQEGDVKVGTYEGQPVYKDTEGNFVYIEKNEPPLGKPSYRRIKMNKYGIPLLASEDDIVFNDPAGRTTVPKRKDPDELIPLPGVSKANPEDDGLSQSDVEKEGDKGKTDDPAGWESAYKWVESNFGHMFDKKLLARMATLYLGSRILGYEHLDSARYAAKDYLDKLDSQGQSGFVKRGGKVYHRQLGVLPTYIAGDKREYVNINGTPYRLDDPLIVPYLEDYQASLHDVTEIKKEFRTVGETYLKGVNQPIEKEADQVPDGLGITISDEAASLYNREKKRFGGLNTGQRENVVRNLNLAQKEYYEDYARWIRDGREDGLEPKSLEVYYQKRKISQETDNIVSSSDIEGTEAKVFGKIDNQIQSKAFAGLEDKTRADLAEKEYKRIWATYKTTWTKYTALANANKAPTLWLNAGGTGVNPFMNWVRECLNKNKKALKVFQDIKQ